jgi:salicylate hydroxylase
MDSRFREKIIDTKSGSAQPVGLSLFRWVMPKEVALAANGGKLPDWLDPEKGAYLNYIQSSDDTNRAIISYPIENFEKAHMSAIFPNHYFGQGIASQSWVAQGDKDTMLDIFKDFPEDIYQCLR